MKKVPNPERWAVLSPRLDVLLDLPEDARAARLTALRLQDAALADELGALLAGAQSARGARFLKQPLTQGALHEAPSLAGMRLGAYTLEAPLGQGGTGTVWRARRDDGRFEGKVAIKLLHLSLLGQGGAERFSREGNILARLNHPHIARLLDAGLTDGGQPYLVLELVRGERLDKHCASKALSVEQKLALFDDALAAVAHAHSHLVIHRDIKPSNIMVTPEGVVKLLDFCIAKLLADESAESSPVDATDLTREWGPALTPEYAAPEQLRGDAVTTATDVYALGVLLYELLSGHLPGPALKRRRLGALTPTADAPLIRPSHVVSDKRLRRRLSGDLDTITLRAMKSEAVERYPTVSAMRDDLARHRSGHPVLARADSVVYRLRKFVGRHRAGCAVTAGVALALLGGAYAQVAVLLALAVGTLLALWQARLAREKTALADEQAALADEQAALARVAQKRAEEVKQFIASIFTEATPREGMGGTVTALDLLTSAVARIEAALTASPGVAGELGVLIARSCSQLGQCQVGARALETALPRCMDFFGARHPLTLHGRMLLLEAHNQASRYDDAERIAAPLVQDLRAMMPTQADLLIQALRASSYVMAKRQDEAGSFAPLHEAIAVSELHLGLTHEQTLETMGFLSNTYKHFGRYEQALEAAEPALQRARSAFGTQRPHTLLAQVERWYADALSGVGRPAQAELVARQVVLDQRALDGEVTTRVVNAMTAHSIALLGQGRMVEAIALATEVVRAHSRLHKTANVDTAHFQHRLALCWLPTRRFAETQAALDADEELWPVLGGEADSVRLRRVRMRALALAWHLDAVGAQDLIDNFELDMLAGNPLEWVRLGRVRAVNFRLQQRWPQALAAAHDAVARCSAQGNLVVPLDRAHAFTELGLAMLGSGDVEGADAHITLAEVQYATAELQPSVVNSDAVIARGQLHFLAGRADDALACFEAVERCWAELHPSSVWHLEAQGAVTEARGAGSLGLPHTV